MYFYGTGERLGQEQLGNWARILGFGRTTGIDLPGECAGLIPNPDWKRARASRTRDRLNRMQAELEYTLEEIRDISRLSPKGSSTVQKGEQETVEQPSADLGLRKARVEQLKKDIAREKSRLALFESERAWVPGNTRNMAIGQGNVLATPLQMARLAAAIANGGTLLQPHLLLRSSSSTNSSLLSGKERVESRAGLKPERKLPVSPANLEVLRRAMRDVVSGRQGTARQKELRKHDVAAKTGTAELGGVWNNGWILGFAPYGAPQISFAVVVERTKYHGGEVAGPLLAKILDAYFGTD